MDNYYLKEEEINERYRRSVKRWTRGMLVAGALNVLNFASMSHFISTSQPQDNENYTIENYREFKKGMNGRIISTGVCLSLLIGTGLFSIEGMEYSARRRENELHKLSQTILDSREELQDG